MRKILTSLFFVGLLIFFTACEVINSEEEVPSYIQIDDIVVNEQNSEVIDAWVYINQNLHGVYELPAHFPVLTSGETDIEIRTGIKMNGIAVSRTHYPFYKTWKSTITLTKGEVTVVEPETSFKENLTFLWEETFESVALSMEPADTTLLSFDRIDTLSNAPSEQVGVIPLAPDSIFTVQTIDQYFLPNDREVYLEMSYKCGYYFEFAWQVKSFIDGQISEARIYQFNPTDKWEHIYIRLTDFIIDYNVSSKFRFMFGSRNNTDETKYIYFDNIRLIHY